MLEPLRDIRNSEAKLEMEVGFRMWKALTTGTRAPSKEFEQERGKDVISHPSRRSSGSLCRWWWFQLRGFAVVPVRDVRA